MNNPPVRLIAGSTTEGGCLADCYTLKNINELAKVRKALRVPAHHLVFSLVAAGRSFYACSSTACEMSGYQPRNNMDDRTRCEASVSMVGKQVGALVTRIPNSRPPEPWDAEPTSDLASFLLGKVSMLKRE